MNAGVSSRRKCFSPIGDIFQMTAVARSILLNRLAAPVLSRGRQRTRHER